LRDFTEIQVPQVIERSYAAESQNSLEDSLDIPLAKEETQAGPSPTPDYEFSKEIPVTEWNGTWNAEYERQTLTTGVAFAPGQQLYKTFLDYGLPEEAARASVETTAEDNRWYSSERLVDGELREGENPLVLDTFPQAGKTYTLTIDASEYVSRALASVEDVVEPAFEPYTESYTPTNGIGVLGALKEVIGDDEVYRQASGVSLIATGLENDLFPERCLTDIGSFNHEVCRPALDIKPWMAGQEYDLVITLPEFSRENDYGGNFDYTTN